MRIRLRAMGREDFLNAVIMERKHQAKRWANGHEDELDRQDDAKNTIMDFAGYIAKYAFSWLRGDFRPYSFMAYVRFRRAMIKVATLAFSAIRHGDRAMALMSSARIHEYTGVQGLEVLTFGQFQDAVRANIYTDGDGHAIICVVRDDQVHGYTGMQVFASDAADLPDSVEVYGPQGEAIETNTVLWFNK